MKKPTYVGFKHKEYKWKPDIDYRKNPHLYEIGRGQQGVLICEPYKSELHPLWRFKTPFEAQESCENILYKFYIYMKEDDFWKALNWGVERGRYENVLDEVFKETNISKDLCDFMGKPGGSQVARTEVTQYIIQYIKQKDLQWAENRKIIKPDKPLKKLLGVEDNEEVTYFNLQKFMNKHFVKKSATTH